MTKSNKNFHLPCNASGLEITQDNREKWQQKQRILKCFETDALILLNSLLSDATTPFKNTFKKVLIYILHYMQRKICNLQIVHISNC